MKKFILILIICSISMSFTFRGCYTYNGFLGTVFGDAGWSYYDDGVYTASTHNIFGIFAGSNGVILKSTGGDTINFTPRSSGTTQDLNALRIQPTNFNPKIFAVGNNGTIIRSTDIGETWIVSAAVTSANLHGTDFNGSNYFAAGDNGVILLSVTEGVIWNQIPSGTNRNLKAISLSSQFGSNIIAVGEKGTIIRTTNSGLNWSNLSLADTTIDFYCATQKPKPNASGNYFYIAGSLGKIYKSTDGGVTWTLKPSGTTNTLRSVYFTSIDSGAVSGDNGTVRMTTNGGDSWFTDPVFSSVSGSITSISQMARTSKTFTAMSGNTLYIVSDDPVVIGIEKISTEIPDRFSLSQNYPNPFNPSTKIKFNITAKRNSRDRSVQLTVFDISGKEIATLVDQDMEPGKYEVDFDGSKYSSGVYFYKLTTEEYTETKRMVLIK